MELNSRQRAYLMSLANELEPIVQIGKNGVSPEAVQSADEAFHGRELLKGAVLKTAPETPRDAAEKLAGRTRSTVVRVIGRRFILYRPDRDKPVIVLPGTRETVVSGD
ncbi:YhbY family RNA-binding protein [Lachnoclostridium sp. Marseille-P6806]|uniref:YhbY family RNA-binding protein n=1 Tax=Lachnoclostridium sp. Marseille-P6806 TaxID=2364793 RepID=UPI001F5F76C3|nr:YhbY family RNA-binding protein [Lachnoclostridium sp. Marseille-P6806]